MPRGHPARRRSRTPGSRKRFPAAPAVPAAGTARITRYGSSPVVHTVRPTLPVRRRPSGPPTALYVAVPVLLLLAGLGLLALGGDDAPPPTSRTVAPAATAAQPDTPTQRPARASSQAQVEDEAAPSPAGSAEVAETEASPAEEEERLRAVAEREKQMLAAEEKWMEGLGKRTRGALAYEEGPQDAKDEEDE